MTDFELQGLLEKEIIYARMAPDHKLRLVAAYQAAGEVVAVTGDGSTMPPPCARLMSPCHGHGWY